MRVYSVELTIRSPTIITRFSDENLLSTYTYLPGSVIRGALITELKNRGIDIIKEEVNNPTMVFHPAFPYENGSIYKLSHPFIYECKICKDIVNNNPYNLLSSDCKFDLCRLKKEKCNNKHVFTLKSKGGKLHSNKQSNKSAYDSKYVILDSIGINRIIESSEIGMLYKYVALAPNQKFKSMIVVNGKQQFDLTKIDKLYVGRGISRGFGEVELSIKDITEEYKRDRKEKILKVLSSSNAIIFRALSTIFDFDFEEDKIRFKVPEIEGLKYEDRAITGYSEVSGYSMIGNVPKIRIKGLKEGSLLVYSTNLDKNRVAELLVEKELNGIGKFSSIGLNIVEVLENDTP